MVCSVRVRARVWVGGGGWGAREGRRCGSARQMDGRVSCSQERPTATQGVVAVCFASTDDDVGGMLRELCNGSASAVEQSVIRVAVPPCDDHAAMQGAENVFRIRPCGRKRWSRAPRRAPVVAAALSQRRSRHWPPMRRRSRRAQNAELCWRQAGQTTRRQRQANHAGDVDGFAPVQGSTLVWGCAPVHGALDAAALASLAHT